MPFETSSTNNSSKTSNGTQESYQQSCVDSPGLHPSNRLDSAPSEYTNTSPKGGSCLQSIADSYIGQKSILVSMLKEDPSSNPTNEQGEPKIKTASAKGFFLNFMIGCAVVGAVAGAIIGSSAGGIGSIPGAAVGAIIGGVGGFLLIPAMAVTGFTLLLAVDIVQISFSCLGDAFRYAVEPPPS